MDYLDKSDVKVYWEKQTDPVGNELAEQVAIALQANWLAYGHRDYCGMGLDYQEGVYRYGEVWDGYLEEKIRFTDRDQFIHWLANQSDASLARLEDKDSFYWGNQTITRQRLKEFVVV